MSTLKVLIGVPSRDFSRTATWQRLGMMAVPAGTPPILTTNESSIARARNRLCQTALAEGVTHLLMVDDDMLVQADTLTRLLAHEVEVVGAHYCTRYPPRFASVVVEAFRDGLAQMRAPGIDRGLQRCAAVGTGCMLIKVAALAALPPPWFVLGDPIPDLLSEDFSFCRRMGDAGISIHVDLDTTVGHVASLAVWPRYDIAWVATMQGVE